MGAVTCQEVWDRACYTTLRYVANGARETYPLDSYVYCSEKEGLCVWQDEDGRFVVATSADELGRGLRAMLEKQTGERVGEIELELWEGENPERCGLEKRKYEWE